MITFREDKVHEAFGYYRDSGDLIVSCSKTMAWVNRKPGESMKEAARRICGREWLKRIPKGKEKLND